MNEKEKGFYSKFWKKYSSETDPGKICNMAHAEFLQKNGMKPQIAIFHHGAVERTEKYLISTGVHPFQGSTLDMF